MIRRGQSSDLADAVRLLDHSRQAAGFGDGGGESGFVFDFDPAYAARLFTSHLVRPNMLCLILQEDDSAQGILMAVATGHPFGEVRIASETVWYIEPDYRGLNAVRMLNAAEDWAREMDCDYFGMAGMGGNPQVASLYKRRGYRTAEVHYLKAL